MNLKTFKAATMAEALSQVKSEMGADAIILHTRTTQIRKWLGFRRREVVEITAGRDLNVTPRGRRTPRQIPTNGTSGSGGSAIYTRTGTVAAPAAPAIVAPRNAVEGGRALLEQPAVNAMMMSGIRSDMDALKTMVRELVTQTHRQSAPKIPDELFEYFLQLRENQVADDLSEEILKALHKEVRTEHLSQPDFIRDKLAEQIEKMIPTCGKIVRNKTSRPYVVALVGPTGVGKTTTIAKLAAHLKLREKHRVGLITLDTYRIAAVDQLKRYADIIGAPLKVVSGIDDLREALHSLRECDFLLIDTAGRSPNDTLKLNELKGLLGAAEPDEVHLVLSATASAECLQLAISRFSDVRVDKMIFTKLDEAARVGVVLNIVRKANKSLSYVTTGQDVPDDIEVAKGRRLAQLILGGSL